MSPLLTVRLYGDPCLRQKAKPVLDVGPSERMLLEAMIETMHAQKGIGLAAPQVGILKRIFVVDIGQGPLVFINPKILKKQGVGEFEEGCLSIPHVNIIVKRAVKILVKYTDEHNKIQERNFEELLARVILHEYDHLNGKLIVDYATKQELVQYEKQLADLKKENK